MATVLERFASRSCLADLGRLVPAKGLSSTAVQLVDGQGNWLHGLTPPKVYRTNRAAGAGVTNYALHSADLSTWTGSGVNSATPLTVTDSDSAAVASRSMSSPIPNDNRSYLWSGLVAKASGLVVGLQVALTGGTTPVTWVIGIDPATGFWSPGGSSKDAVVSIQDAGASWLVTVLLVNNGTGNTACVTTFYPAYAPALVVPNQTAATGTTGTSGLTSVQIEALPASAFRVECEGDSITSGATYPPYSSGLGLAPGVSVFNTGNLGDTTSTMQTRFDGYKTNGYTHFCLLGGVNDIAGGATLASIQGRLSYMWSQAKALGMVVVAMTLTPWEGSSAWTSAFQSVTDSLNSWIRSQAAANGYVLVDTNLLLRDPANPTKLLPAYDATDHIHPNALGRQVMAAAIRSAIGIPAPNSSYVGPTTTAALTGLETTVLTVQALSSVPRGNALVNSVLAGGGATPTGWTALVGTGISTPVASAFALGDGAVAYYQSSDGTTRPAFYQSIPLLANTAYCFSLLLESVSSLLTPADIIGSTSYPAGTTFAFPPCPANPAGGASSYLTAGALYWTVTTAGAAGNLVARLGLGAMSAKAGTLQFSRPQVEPGSVRSAFVPTTTAAVNLTDYTLGADGALTLGSALGAQEDVRAALPSVFPRTI